MAQNKAKKFVWTSGALILMFLAVSGWGRLTGLAPIAEAHAVEVDGMLLEIEALKDDVVGRLIKCESEGHSEADGIIVFDVNRVPSIGQFQFQRKTVQHYVREIEGRAITGKEAIEIALDTEYAPVCARLSGNTTTYSNQCFARAAGAEVIAQGPCAVNSSPAPK